MRRLLAASAVAVAIAATPLATPAGAVEIHHVIISHVTVTSAKAEGESAVVLSIDNTSKGPISLLSITSPDSRMSMIYFDTNMCQGNHAMIWLTNILIMRGHVQKLGYQYQGAMISKLRQPLLKGSTVPLRITWSDFQKAHTVTVEAKVVAPPKHLRFHMTPMHM